MSYLYLKETLVATLQDKGGIPVGIKSVDAPELLPMNLSPKATDEEFQAWLTKRNMPTNREGLDATIKRFGDEWLQSKNYASLSDHYWIKKRGETYKEINFFTNNYSQDIGDMFYKPWEFHKSRILKNSPDLTTTGVLMKRWIQRKDKKSFLVKSGSVRARQEPLNEVLVSTLCERLGKIKSANYTLHVEGISICSMCPNFLTINTELVPASQFYNIIPPEDGESVYKHLIKVCDKLEIPGAKDFIHWMVFIDNMTGNEDRHLNNIGFIRDVNTRKFLGPAPLFDCGNAYWNTSKIGGEIRSKTFGDVERQIVALMSKKCDMKALLKDNEKDLARLINRYPEISDTKKEHLITAIHNRNEKILLHGNIEKSIFGDLKEREKKAKERAGADNAKIEPKKTKGEKTR